MRATSALFPDASRRTSITYPGKVGDEYFLAQEYILGRDLARITARIVERHGTPLPYPVMLHVAHETLKALGSFKDSIGMMTMNAKAFSAADVRLLTIDNIAATRDTLSNGTYPIRRPLFFVYNTEPAKVKPTIKAFIDFVKGSEGQKILAGL